MQTLWDDSDSNWVHQLSQRGPTSSAPIASSLYPRSRAHANIDVTATDWHRLRFLLTRDNSCHCYYGIFVGFCQIARLCLSRWAGTRITAINPFYKLSSTTINTTLYNASCQHLLFFVQLQCHIRHQTAYNCFNDNIPSLPRLAHEYVRVAKETCVMEFFK